MSIKAVNFGPKIPRQMIIDFTQALAVQNTWYTAFEGRNVVLLGGAVGILLANETCEIRVTVDDVVYTTDGGVALTAGGNFLSRLPQNAYGIPGPTWLFTQAGAGAAITIYPDTFAKGRSVKIEVRKTTAAGGSSVVFYGVYGQW